MLYSSQKQDLIIASQAQIGQSHEHRYIFSDTHFRAINQNDLEE